MSVHQNVKVILKELGNTKLVCVTKTVDAQRINESIRAGATIIGESKVQEYESKCDDLLPCERHLIGHLQSNKVRKAVQLFDVIQTVDSLKLIQDINKKAGAIGKVQRVFLQINIGKEPQKFGFMQDEILQTATVIRGLKNIRVEGLMCIPPFGPPEQTRSYFKRMKALYDEMQQNGQKTRYSEL